MAFLGAVGDDPQLTQLLITRRAERDDLVTRARRLIQSDPRVDAAWLYGSGGRGTTDELSDIDLSIAVGDADLAALAGGPTRPATYRNIASSARAEFLLPLGEPTLLLEAPQNAPAGGAFVSAFYPGQAGPQQLDMEWQPSSTARVPPAARVLFNRGVRIEPDDPGNQPEVGEVPTRTPLESAVHESSAFWAMLLWNAKQVGRFPQNDEFPLLRYLLGSINQVEAFLSDHPSQHGGGPDSGVNSERVLALLHNLACRMHAMEPQLASRGVELPDTVAAQAHSYLQLVKRLVDSRAQFG